MLPLLFLQIATVPKPTWQIEEDGTGVTMASGGPYEDVTGGVTNVEDVCLAPGCYVFTINDSYGDGLYGSQWTCNVDGDYFMEDQTGANLFQMTAPNGDFGNQTTHNFCITSNLSLDAGLSGISYPLWNHLQLINRSGSSTE